MKKTLVLISILLSQFALADAWTVKGMTCGACVKQVTEVICQDKEMSQWFEKCSAKILDSDKQLGQLNFTLKKSVSLDSAKTEKIKQTIADTGRSVENQSK